MKYIYNVHGYQGFAQGLKSLCKQYNINNGDLNVFPFSLGKVCFKDYCIFDGRYTEDIITELVKRTYCHSSSKIVRFFHKLLKS